MGSGRRISRRAGGRPRNRRGRPRTGRLGTRRSRPAHPEFYEEFELDTLLKQFDGIVPESELAGEDYDSTEARGMAAYVSTVAGSSSGEAGLSGSRPSGSRPSDPDAGNEEADLDADGDANAQAKAALTADDAVRLHQSD